MRKYGLIGNPLSHSFSERYFNIKFRDEEIKDCSYQLFPLQKIDDLLPLLSATSLDGFNVTIPYKQSILSKLDELSPEAKAIGAVNCVVVKDERLIGHNTDVYGFEESLFNWLAPTVKNALILGNGGSAKAVKFALNRLGIAYSIVSRRGTLTYENLPASLVHESTLIVNTTPLGQSPNLKEFADIPFEAIGSKHFVFDLIYNPSKTTFLKKAEIAGAIIKNGSEMLKLQADKSWEIWNKE